MDHNQAELQLAESDFEKEVLQILLNKGYIVHPQWKVGAYRIDMVVEDGDNRVALECDGERWHTQDDLVNDLKRQAILERLGWRFIRIRGSAFYRDPEKAMEWVFEELDGYNIKPNYFGTEETNDKSGTINDKLIDNIKRRAEEIRMELKDGVTDSEHIYLDESFNEETNEEPAEVMADHVKEDAQNITFTNSPTLDENRKKLAQHENTVFIYSQEKPIPKKNADTNKNISLFDFTRNKDGKSMASKNRHKFKKVDVDKEESVNKKGSQAKSADTNKPKFDFRKK